MSEWLKIELNPMTWIWLQREARAAQRDPASFVSQLLGEIADPEHAQGELVDRLLAEASLHFPPTWSLEEKLQRKNDLLAFLCQQVIDAFHLWLGEGLTEEEQVAFREQVLGRANGDTN